MATPHPYPLVSIVIPARNASDTIIPTLRSILGQDCANELEIIIADGSDDSVMKGLIQSRFAFRPGTRLPHPAGNGHIRIIDNPEKTIPAGLNLAIQAATGDIIARVDAHNILSPDYITRALESLDQDGVVCVGGRAVPVGRNFFGQAVGHAIQSPLVSGGSRYKVGGSPGPADSAYLGVFRKESWEAVGGYDESLHANEDYEFTWKLRKIGIVWFDPHVASTRLVRENPIALAKQGFHYGRWKSTMLLRNPRSVRPRQLASPMILLLMFAFLIFGLLRGNISFALIWFIPYLVIPCAEFARNPRQAGPHLLLYPIIIPIMHLSWGLGFFLPHLRKARR